MGVPAPARDAGDVQPVEREPRDRVIAGLVTVVRMLAVGVAAWRAWFTRRSFKARRVVQAVLGSAAIEGPVISWMAGHRKHHAVSDRRGDPTARTSITTSAGRERCAAWCTPMGLIGPAPITEAAATTVYRRRSRGANETEVTR